MRTKWTLTIAGLAVVSFLALSYFFGVHTGKPRHGGTVQAQTAGGHQGHGKVAQESRTDQQSPATQESAPVQAESGGEPPAVEITPEGQKLIGVKIVEAKVKPLRKVIRTAGIVGYDERRLATVNAKFDGWIEKLHADFTGRYVRKGEPLAEIYSPELYATQQELLNLVKWEREKKGVKDDGVAAMLAGDARVITEAARQRLRLWDISDEQIRQVEQTGKPVRTLTLYSPVNGYIVEKAALRGTRVRAGEKLFDIADLSTVWIMSEVFEYELPMVREGQRAMVSLSYFRGKEFPSTVEYVYPTITGETRSARVRLTVPNQGGSLKPQMYTNVEVKIELGKALVIPDDAILDTGVRKIVYADKGEGYFEPREVQTGRRSEGLVEVTKGLKAGDRVASSATFLIDSEARLKGVVK